MKNEGESRIVKILRKLYNQKILSLAFLLLLLAVICFVIAKSLEMHKLTLPAWLWFFPFQSLGDASFVAALVGFAYEWIVRDESERRLEESIGALMDSNAQSIANRLRELMLTDAKLLYRLFKPSERKSIIEAAIQAELGDDQIGQEIYQSLIKRAVGYTEHWQNYRCAATLTEIRDDAARENTRNTYFHCYYDIRYDTRLKQRPLTFTCVSTIEEYNEHLADNDCEMCWLFPMPVGHVFAEESAFSVSSVRVGSLTLNLTRPIEKNTGFRILYIADHPELPKLVGKQVTVQYRVDVRVKKRGHLLTLNFVYPTKHISMEIDVADTDISYITARDFFASNLRPMIRYIPALDSARKITVEIDDWVFPKGGVDFIWSLKSERPQQLQVQRAGFTEHN